MLARRIILGFGFAVVLPLLVHYGIDAFHSAPDRSGVRAEIGRLSARERDAAGAEKETLRAERERLEATSRSLDRAESRVHFFVGAPIGIAVTLIGSLVRAQAIGGGLMLGGIFTFTGGCFYYWDDLPPAGRFAVLCLAFVVLLWIGYQRLAELQPSRPRSESGERS
jgi:hypothetical protein